MAERIPVASDHAGYELKEKVVEFLKELGYQPEDMGTDGKKSVDYPDYASLVAGSVSRGEYKRGILICGSGIGMSISANKFPGVRAALAVDEEMALLARSHNDANILALGARTNNVEKVKKIVKIWLECEFTGGRHTKRVEKIAQIEARSKPL